jgi:hypothetical protein
MVLITSNKHQRLLYFNYVQRVTPQELESGWDGLVAALAELPAGFRLLADLSQLEFMDPECSNQLGRAMDLIDQREVGLIVRVIPDPSKDIGLSILTIFHYPRQPRIITCNNLAEAIRQLALWT